MSIHHAQKQYCTVYVISTGLKLEITTACIIGRT